jgi:hypothetical protein
MPGLSVQVNGERMVTIDLSGLNLVNVFVHGALDREQHAKLDAQGGQYGDGGSGHLIWIAEHALTPGDVVTLTYMEACEDGDQGKTMAQLWPDEPASTRTDWSIDSQMEAEMRARPRLRDGFLVQVATSAGACVTAASDARNTDFSFGVLWSDFGEERARVRLSTYCLDDVLQRTGGTERLETALSFGDSVTFSLLR